MTTLQDLKYVHIDKTLRYRCLLPNSLSVNTAQKNLYCDVTKLQRNGTLSFNHFQQY